MNFPEVALDTNIAIGLINENEFFLDYFDARQNMLLALPLHSLGELFYGALNSQRIEQNLERIGVLRGRVRVLKMKPTTAEYYGSIKADLQRQGTLIPENDIWIAAECLLHGLPLLTLDAHFHRVEGLTVLNLA